MKSNKLMNFLGKAEIFTKKNSPTILAGMAIVGVISTAYSSYKSGLRADKILKIYKEDMRDCDQNDKETKKVIIGETIKRMTPIMIPPIIIGSATISCIIGSHSISSRRIAVLSAAYTLSESTVKNLNEKMEEILGEKKTKVIKDSIMKDKLDRDYEKDKKVIDSGDLIMSTDGTVLCKDMYSGRLFYSNAEKIKQAIAKCSYDIVSDMYISLNDFYEAIDSPNLEPIPMGNDLGWNIDDTDHGRLPITIGAVLTNDNQPCICVDYDISVRNDYRNLH